MILADSKKSDHFLLVKLKKTERLQRGLQAITVFTTTRFHNISQKIWIFCCKLV